MALHLCSTTANPQSFKDIKYSGEHKTSKWITTLCRTPPGISHLLTVSLSHGGRWRGPTKRPRGDMGSRDVLGMVLVSKHRAKSGAATRDCSKHLPLPSFGWSNCTQTEAELAELFHRSRHPGAELENHNGTEQDICLPRTWHLRFYCEIFHFTNPNWESGKA